MVKTKTTILVGMKAIRQYVGRSEATVLKWIKEDGFPAKKVDGVWESDTVLIEKWRRKMIAERK
ncbi:hypothetical protein [Deferribacter abyssi]|uniref:hypothetical protein n=1 Tax=Deferribacter abyssi TaxID=213806 RepID=UPI003C178ABF